MDKTLRSACRSLKTPGNIPSLDGLRAIAILLVLMTHICQRIPGLSFVAWNTEWAMPLFNGWIGVDLFFVLSGFLIGSLIIKSLNNNHFSIPSFYQRRFFRILPAYFFIIFLVIGIKKFFPQVTFLEETTTKDILCSLGLLTDYVPTNMPIGSWSLSIEEHFYLLLPAFFIFFRKTESRVKAALILIFLTLFFRMLTYRAYSISDLYPIEALKALIYFPFHNRMDSLAVGVLIALLHANLPTLTENNGLMRSVIGWLGLLLVGFVFASGALQGGFFNTTIQYSLVALGFGGILWSVLGQGAAITSFQKYLSHRVWIPVARISYSTYLTHILTLKILSSYFVFRGWMFFIILAICLFAAVPLYLLIEYPFHQLGKKRSASDAQAPDALPSHIG